MSAINNLVAQGFMLPEDAPPVPNQNISQALSANLLPQSFVEQASKLFLAK